MPVLDRTVSARFALAILRSRLVACTSLRRSTASGRETRPAACSSRVLSSSGNPASRDRSLAIDSSSSAASRRRSARLDCSVLSVTRVLWKRGGYHRAGWGSAAADSGLCEVKLAAGQPALQPILEPYGVGIHQFPLMDLLDCHRAVATNVRHG